MKILPSGLACSFLAAACALPSPPGERMTGEAFMAAARGNTMDGHGEGGAVFQTYVAPDLQQRGTALVPGAPETRFSGVIRAADHGFCSQSPQLRNGAERCFEVWREGATYRTVWNGRVWTTMVIRPGNPFGL